MLLRDLSFDLFTTKCAGFCITFTVSGGFLIIGTSRFLPHRGMRPAFLVFIEVVKNFQYFLDHSKKTGSTW